MLAVSCVLAQTAPAQPAADVLPTIDVVGGTPLSGSGIDVEKTPSAVVTIDAQQIARTHSPDVVKALAQQTPSVTVDVSSGNAFQPDVSFRGFTASPVAGTPEGLAIMYKEGRGLPQDYALAHMWFNLAAAHARTGTEIGDAARRGRDELAVLMTRDQIAEAQRLAREWNSK